MTIMWDKQLATLNFEEIEYLASAPTKVRNHW